MPPIRFPTSLLLIQWGGWHLPPPNNQPTTCACVGVPQSKLTDCCLLDECSEPKRGEQHPSWREGKWSTGPDMHQKHLTKKKTSTSAFCNVVICNQRRAASQCGWRLKVTGGVRGHRQSQVPREDSKDEEEVQRWTSVAQSETERESLILNTSLLTD